MNWPEWLIIAGGTLSLIGAFFSSQQDNKDKEKIIELTEQNAHLAGEALNQITGGNTWAYLAPGVRFQNGLLPNLGLVINLVGRYGLHEVKVEIFQVTRSQNPHGSTNYNKVYTRDYGTLIQSLNALDSSRLIFLNLPPGNPYSEFMVTTNARNGVVNQHLIFQRNVHDHFDYATRVFKYNQIPNDPHGGFAREVLMTTIDPNFQNPQNIQWLEH